MLSRRSGFDGGSCGPSAYSRPFVLRFAMDATSMTIDFLKGNVEEDVVDNPPSWGPVRISICSPFPLKRMASIPS